MLTFITEREHLCYRRNSNMKSTLSCSNSFVHSLMQVEELIRYLKGKQIDAATWPLRYPDPCPQQGSGDDCGIFTCKYMECLARTDIQDLPFSQNDMPIVRAKIALHFIKAYFNGEGRS